MVNDLSHPGALTLLNFKRLLFQMEVRETGEDKEKVIHENRRGGLNTEFSEHGNVARQNFGYTKTK